MSTNRNQIYVSIIHLKISIHSQDQKPEAEAQAIGRVRSSVYQEYFLAGTSYVYVFIAGILFFLAQFFASASDFWISKWWEYSSR